MQPVIAASLGSAASAPSSIPRGSPAKIAQCAKDFEGLLVAQMLRSAREAGGGDFAGDGDDENEANSTLVELGEQQLAQALANSGALGIGKIVTAGLVKNAD
jgi:Rod binding domain-containing protein